MDSKKRVATVIDRGDAETVRLAGTGNSENAPTAASAQDGIAITQDGVLIGFIVVRRDGCDAIAASGRRIGKFNTQSAAVRALLYAANIRDGDDA